MPSPLGGHFTRRFAGVALPMLGGLLALTPLHAQQTASAANTPDWQQLDAYQMQTGKADFTAALNTIFAPAGAAAQTISISGNGADIVTENGNPRKGRYRLMFAPQPQGAPAATGSDQAGNTATDSTANLKRDSGNRGNLWQSAAPKPSAPAAATQPITPATATASAPLSPPARQAGNAYWKSAEEIRALGTAEQPLKGLRVALDPGHIGGEWATMEQREWSFGGGAIFREGDFVLRVAELLAIDLRALGATVMLVRSNAEPLTAKRPKDFVTQSRERLTQANGGHAPSAEAIRRDSELQFYRSAEIRARAATINNELKPDAVVCLHVDGASFPPAGSQNLPRGGALHVLVNGAYSAEELANDDHRHAMLMRLLGDVSQEEIALADVVARHIAKDSGLPAFNYTGANAARVNSNPYVWARNLIANRLYNCPTVFIEAHTANREPFYSRFQMGEYEGTRLIDGQPRKNIYREYADSVRDALLAHYGARQ